MVHRQRFRLGVRRARLTLGESFRGIIHSRFRGEFLNTELYASVPEARLLAKQYRMEYNTY